MTLTLNVLGPPSLYFDASDPIILKSRKAQGIFVYLALQGGVHERRGIAGIFWQNLPLTNALRNLRSELHKMGELRPYILADKRTITFHSQLTSHNDYQQFRTLLSHPQPTPDQLRQAVALYRGDFLGNMTLPHADGFNDWVAERRAWCQTKVGDARLALGKQALRDRQFEAGLRHADHLLALDPFLETAHRLKMVLLAESGRRAEAVAQFDILTEMLAEELGVSPAEESFAVARRIEQGVEVVEKTGHVPYLMPALTTHFVGRETDLQQLESRLLGENAGIQIIAGMGGVGKTTLATHTAHRLRPHFPDGVLWADARTDPHRIVEDWATHFGYDFSLMPNLTEKATALKEAIAGKQLLIVFDNVGSVAQIRPLLPDTPTMPVLLTTRKLDEPIDSLRPTVFQLNTLTQQQSFQLLGKLLGDARVQNEAEAAESLCLLTEQLPLALEIVGRRLTTQAWQRLPLQRMVARLQNSRQKMAELSVADVAVRSSFEMSWGSLTADLQMVFAGLAVFGGRSFLVEAIAGILRQPIFPTEDRLLALTALSLLNHQPTQRFRQHALLADYAGIKLKDDSLYERMAHYFAEFAKTNQRNYGVLEPEWGNLNAGMEQAYQRRQWQVVVNFADSLAHPWSARTRYQQAQQGFKWALQSAMQLEDDHRIAQNYYNLGRVDQKLGNYPEATSYFQQSVSIWEGLGDLQQVGQAKVQLGRIHIDLANYEEATQALQLALQKFETTDDAEGISLAYYGLGRVYAQRREIELSLEWAFKALELQREMPASRHLIRTLILVAQNYLSQGKNFTEIALPYCQEAHQLSQNLSRLNDIATSSYLLASLFRLNDEPKIAVQYIQECLQAYQACGDKRSISATLYELGIIYEKLNELYQAVEYNQQFLNLVTTLGDQLGIAYGWQRQGDLALRLGDKQKATKHWQQSLIVARHLNIKPLIQQLFHPTRLNKINLPDQ